MRSYKVAFIFLLLFFATSKTFSQLEHNQGNEAFNAQRLERIPELIKEYIDSGKIPFANILISYKNKIIMDKSFGDVTENSIFRLASMSKIITSVAVLQLAEEGRILLSDKINKYIPEFSSVTVLIPDSVDDDNPITYKIQKAKKIPTIYNFLTHTSGVAYSFSDNKTISDIYREAGVNDGVLPTNMTIADNVKKIAKLPLLFEPGTNWEYGLSTDILGYLIEKVSGLDLETYLVKNIFAPLEMNDTYFHLPKEKSNRLVPLYSVDTNKKVFKLSSEEHEVIGLRFNPDFPLEGKSKLESGGGGLVSTIKDYYNFCKMMINKGKYKDKTILSPASINLFYRLYTKFDIGAQGYKFSFGAAVRTEDELAKSGELIWAGIFYTRFYIDPNEDLIILFFSQVIPYFHIDLHKKIRVITYSSLVN